MGSLLILAMVINITSKSILKRMDIISFKLARGLSEQQLNRSRKNFKMRFILQYIVLLHMLKKMYLNSNFMETEEKLHSGVTLKNRKYLLLVIIMPLYR